MTLPTAGIEIKGHLEIVLRGVCFSKCGSIFTSRAFQAAFISAILMMVSFSVSGQTTVTWSASQGIASDMEHYVSSSAFPHSKFVNKLSQQYIVSSLIQDSGLGNSVSLMTKAPGDYTISIAGEADVIFADRFEGLSVSNFVSDRTVVLPGEILEFNWTSTRAETCSPAGDLPGWIGQEIDLSGPLSFAVPAFTPPSTYTAFVQCFAGDNFASSNIISVQVKNPKLIDPPFIPSFNVSPTTVQRGQIVQISWSSTDADTCSVPPPVGSTLPGWSGNKPASGSETVAISASLAPGVYVVRLRCQNFGGMSPIASQTVIVQDTTPATCSPNQLPPSSMTRAKSCRQDGGGSCLNYDDVFGGFPGTTRIQFFTLQRDQYAALPFTPESVPATARLDLVVDVLQTGGIPSGQLLWSISTCPGDFNKNAVINVMGDPACFMDGFPANSGFRFGGLSFFTDPIRCALSLPPGTTYYLNITYSNDNPDFTPGSDLEWACGPDDAPVCGHRIQPQSIRNWWD